MTKGRAVRVAWLWLALWFGLSALAFVSQGAEHHLPLTLLEPRWPDHPLGCDAFGRDLLAITMRASLVSCGFALLAVSVSCALSLLLGTATALAPPRVRFLSLRLIELSLAFPSLLLALAWAAVRGPGWDTLAVALGIGVLPALTRFVQVRARELLEEDYIAAARAVGASPARLVRAHLSPAVLSLCAIKAPGLFAQALLAEASLSFLGVGAPVGRDTWGTLLAQGRDYLLEAPNLAFGAGLPLLLTVLSLQSISGGFTEKRFRR